MAGNKRQYGTGSVFYRKADDRWIGQLVAGLNPSGSRRYLTVSYKAKPGQSKTACEAEVKRRLEAKAKIIAATGIPVAGLDQRITVATWSKTWLEARAGKSRASTTVNDVGAVRKWIIPTLGTRRLDALTPADVRRLAAAVTAPKPDGKPGLSTTTARTYQSIFLKMLKAAVLEGHQVSPRVFLVEAPVRAVHDRDAIPLVDALKLLAAATKHPDAPRWVAGLLQGMRQGECLGLTWPAIDFESNLIDVTWQLQTLPYIDRAAGTFLIKDGMRARHLEGTWHLTEVKTSTGVRVIPMVPWMRAALLRWRSVAPASEHELVWPRPNGMPRDDKADRLEWQALQDAAKVRHPAGRYFHVHEMRHTTATLLMVGKTDAKVITAILGHSSIVTSQGYIHSNQDLTRSALDGVAARLGLEA